MNDLIGWMLQWTFSIAGLIHLVGIGLLAGVAILLSPNRSVGKFCLVAFALWLIASALGASASHTARTAVAGVIWAFTVVAFYTVFLGLLVAKGKGPRTMLATSAVLLLIQAPLSLLSGLYLTCYVGHDCP